MSILRKALLEKFVEDHDGELKIFRRGQQELLKLEHFFEDMVKNYPDEPEYEKLLSKTRELQKAMRNHRSKYPREIKNKLEKDDSKETNK